MGPRNNIYRFKRKVGKNYEGTFYIFNDYRSFKIDLIEKGNDESVTIEVQCPPEYKLKRADVLNDDELKELERKLKG